LFTVDVWSRILVTIHIGDHGADTYRMRMTQTDKQTTACGRMSIDSVCKACDEMLLLTITYTH